jgi:cephalosporin-C deacetylase-like acetyl esterase
MIKYLVSALLVLYAPCTLLNAQPQKKLIEVQVAPTKADWIYQAGERVEFEVRILKNGQPLPDCEIRYQTGLEKMPPEQEGTMTLKDGTATIKSGTLDQPGFLRCEVWVTYDGETYHDWGTAGFDPDKIEPTVEMPADFDEFWSSAKQELAALPIDAKLTLEPELSTADINVFHVSLQNIQTSWRGSSRFYGMLSVPTKPGKYPAILNVPGAGVRSYGRDDRAANGVIVFKVGIHGIPVNLPDEVYQSLGAGALGGYQNFNLDDKDLYYYKRVYLGCVRAIDFIFSLPEFDGETLAVTGGSQGGALSIITAGLDQRIDYLAAYYPALSDVTGYVEGRAGGWPHMFMEYDQKKHPDWIKTIGYYDVVNFARKLTMPGWYSWGFNDHVCPPTSMYAAYNSITAPKELHIYQETEHWTFPEQREQGDQWLFEKVGVGGSE